MGATDPLGHVEFAVLDAVHRGSLRHQRTADQVRGLREQPAGQVILHDALRSCERDGLVSSTRDSRGRLYQLTAAGRARLRADRRFRATMVRMLLRAQPVRDAITLDYGEIGKLDLTRDCAHATRSRLLKRLL